MKILTNILWSLIATPLVLVGGVLYGLLLLILTPVNLLSCVLLSIWEVE